MTTSTASSNVAAMRQSKLVGAAGIGPGALLGGNGGSKTPIPVRLRGGPPPRAEAGCGSSSNSFSAKSQGTVENATPWLKNCLEKAEDSFDGDPGRNGAARGIMRRHKFPAANGLPGAFIKSQADSFDDADLRSASVDANQYLQRHGSLQLGLARFIRVLGIGAIGAPRWKDDIRVRTIVSCALSCARSFVITHAAVGA